MFFNKILAEPEFKWTSYNNRFRHFRWPTPQKGCGAKRKQKRKAQRVARRQQR